MDHAGLPAGHVRKHHVATGADIAERAAAFDRIFQRMDTFNQDALGVGSLDEGEREKAKEDLFGRDRAIVSTRTLEIIADGYAISNKLSLVFRRRTV